jgi:hypothetical protein
MAGASESDDREPTLGGEVWTDARGYATVALPRSAWSSHAGVDYELRPLTPGVNATVAAQLVDGRFTIATDEPHVKVTWRVIAHHSSAAFASDSREGER